MSAIDKDVLDTMTDEERAILESDEWKEDQDASVKRPDMREGDDADEDDDADDANDEQPAEAAAVVAENPVAEVVQEEAKADEPVEATKPVYRATLPADYAEQVQALTDQDADLADKFRAGELDFDEFRTQSAELNARRYELSMQKVKAEISQEMSAQTAEATWQETIDTFMIAMKKDEGVDYRTDATKQKDLDRYVKALAADDDNADKPMAWFLEEAHRIVRFKHNIQAPAAKTQTSTKRPAPLSQVPKTLAGVPGTDGPGDVGGDEFQDIDRMEGLDLEEAVARLSPAARAKYLSAA